ncbi:unnamed protein product [Lactuca virosa]|uniref:RING-type E3 ubiquitin transferase n=1 Tax=Lactuca virosa TaxID=75947 RepID=A0AAU9P6C7_9ASTR|nr:unnamed protein product [Lactuca virosa]
MGSEVELIEETIEEFNDVENTVIVAVGRNVKESKSLILWALQCFAGMKMCLLHIHKPAPLITLVDGKFYESSLKQQVVKAWRELEKQKMHKILNQYRLILDEAGVEAGKVWIEADNVETGIVQTIEQHGIKWLVMGAAAEKLYSKDMSELKSNKSIYVCQNAPPICQIWFACKGHLIYTRSMKALSSLPAGKETMLTLCHAIDADVEVKSIRCLENSMKNGCSSSTSTHLMIDDTKDQLVQSLSDMFLEKPQGLSSSELHDKLEYAKTDAENSKQKAFEESIRRWRAEEDAKDILHKAETSENTCMEEITERKAMEAKLSKQIEEIETMKNQRDEFIKELQKVKNQKPELEDQISKARDTEKELEERIIQAVNLLITFKESRDKLQDEVDNARRQIKKLTKYIKEDTTTNLSQAQFYKPSFMEIMEATQDFNQSLKIGEGRDGSVYKGILRHVRVAIKMLPSLGSQSDAEFELEVEVLSRTRHPNIVTLIGVCSATRSLIYEYLENGSLEDRIISSNSKATTPPLPWHTRIRIASEISSALIFLHSSNPQIIHGNVTPTNVLLDSNHVSKLSDFGISFVFSKINDPEVSAYIDPEFVESGTLSPSSDVYSFGVVLLRMLTGRPASSVVNDTKCAMEFGNFVEILDLSAGDWPIEHANELADLSLRCCEKNPLKRPNLVNDIWKTFEKMKDRFTISPVEPECHRKIPSYFVCPIFQEVMKDPYIAADGFTYEEDAIKGWLNSGHKTSPMTNLQLEHCDLLPNHALSYAIQEWQQIS